MLRLTASRHTRMDATGPTRLKSSKRAACVHRNTHETQHSKQRKTRQNQHQIPRELPQTHAKAHLSDVGTDVSDVEGGGLEGSGGLLLCLDHGLAAVGSVERWDFFCFLRCRVSGGRRKMLEGSPCAGTASIAPYTGCFPRVAENCAAHSRQIPYRQPAPINAILTGCRGIVDGGVS